FTEPHHAGQTMGRDSFRLLAKVVAREGAVLLKNEGPLLPLRRDLGCIAVIGPNADDVYNQLGDYTSPQHPGATVTLLNGIRGAVSSQTEVLYAKGCAIRDPSRAGFERALDAASRADVVVLCLGGSSARDFDRDDLSAPEQGAMGLERTSPDIECGEGLDR